MSSKIKLDYLQILDKDFSVKPNGYDAKEVDLFLDTIIEDYKAYEEINNQFVMLQKMIIKVLKMYWIMQNRNSLPIIWF